MTVTIRPFFTVRAPGLALDSGDLRTAYRQHWRGSVSAKLCAAAVLEVVRALQATKCFPARDINQPSPSHCHRGLPFVTRQIFFDDINQIESRANSRYDSLQARCQQR